MDRRTFLLTFTGAALAATTLPGMEAEAAPNWIKLGTRKVNGFIDVDRIHVGSDDGRFRKLRLRVRGNDLFLFRMKATFENGGSQEFSIRLLIPKGGYTRSLDLKGDRRFIRHVDFFYGKPKNGGGGTFVDLYGQR